MADMLLHLGILLVICFGVCFSADVSETNGGIYVEVLRETGKVSFGYQQNLTNHNYTVSFQATKINELNGSLSEIGNEGTFGHSYSSFVNVTTFSNAIDTTVSNISARYFSMYLTLSNSAILQVGVTIFGASGTVQTTSGQTITVAAGNILFTLNMTLWKFCGVEDNCTLDNVTRTGEYIDMKFTFTSPSAFTSQTHNVTDVSKYSLGGNSVIYFPGKYTNGNTTESFPNTYPLVQTQDVTFRFMKFDSFVAYNFAVDMGSDPNSGSSSGERHTTKMSAQALFILFALTLIGKPLIL